ncbi:hypothetical protein LTR78_010592 [Recurvomyces mirabilis]|uniref:SET domain-containing protein n=1 Tax=Recurvomyces mirabilis TaxID=574656 RepID=A0AAE0TM54_9PEZI|nr:hypothetical protein LTR78_010592 [Recurvomyces mirabilis]KAK5150136.1 hypothetical protein LTS14_010399 [Recurvomyces mirabilis]
MEKGTAETQLKETESVTRQYAVRPVHSKGQGLVAMSKIRKGTRILAEAPILKVPRHASDLQAVSSIIVKQLRTLSRDQQTAFFELHNAHGKRHDPPLGIMKTNVPPLGSDSYEGGLFLTASRINHSCRNNAQNTWNEKIGCITIHAVKDIEEGQEVPITYLGQAAPYAERQRSLRNKFFFDCKCELCSLPQVKREESDGRQQMIQDIDESIGSSAFGGGIEIGLKSVRVLLELLDQEGITDTSIPRAYYDAFQIAIAHGDKARAKVFAERAYAARVIAEGDDSPETTKLKRLVKRPTEHLSIALAPLLPQQPGKMARALISGCGCKASHHRSAIPTKRQRQKMQDGLDTRTAKSLRF